MKKYLPFIGLLIFVAGVFFLAGMVHQRKESVPVEAPRQTLTVYSDIPVEAGDILEDAFLKQYNIAVRIYVMSDEQIMDSLKTNKPDGGIDLLLASEYVLKEAAEKKYLFPYTSEQTDFVRNSYKNSDGYWTGVWLDPIVFAVNEEYYKQHGDEILTWENLLREPDLRVAMVDLTATKTAANFLYNWIEYKGLEEGFRYLKGLHRHVQQYTKYSPTPVRMAALDEVDIGISNGSEAWLYAKEKFPLKIIYPQDGTAYYVTGAAILEQSGKKEAAALFVDWLYSKEVQDLLESYQLYYEFLNGEGSPRKDDRGQELVLLPVEKNYQDSGKDVLLDLWIKQIRFGKDTK